MKLVLGTVNMGMPYGLPGREKKLSREQSFKILECAYEHGIRFFDTAEAYGDAESVLGEFIKVNGIKYINVFTKLMPNLVFDDDIIRTRLSQSLERLNVDALWGYYLHTPANVYLDDVVSQMYDLRNEGLFGSVGVSVYSIVDAEYARDHVDLIQYPLSVFDRRFVNFDKKYCLSAVRTTFLKGLLTCPDGPPEYLPYIEKYKELINWHGYTATQGAINFVKAVGNIDYCVFGVSSVDQLLADIGCFGDNGYFNNVMLAFKNMKPLIFNSLWSKEGHE